MNKNLQVQIAKCIPNIQHNIRTFRRGANSGDSRCIFFTPSERGRQLTTSVFTMSLTMRSFTPETFLPSAGVQFFRYFHNLSFVAPAFYFFLYSRIALFFKQNIDRVVSEQKFLKFLLFVTNTCNPYTKRVRALGLVKTLRIKQRCDDWP